MAQAPIAAGPLEASVRGLHQDDRPWTLVGAMLATAELCEAFVPWVREIYGLNIPDHVLIHADVQPAKWAEVLRAFDASHPNIDWPVILAEHRARLMSPNAKVTGSPALSASPRGLPGYASCGNGGKNGDHD